MQNINMVAMVSIRNQKTLLSDSLGWNFATFGFFTTEGNHIE